MSAQKHNGIASVIEHNAPYWAGEFAVACTYFSSGERALAYPLRLPANIVNMPKPTNVPPPTMRATRRAPTARVNAGAIAPASRTWTGRATMKLQ